MAHFGGWVDEILMRIIEVLNSIPSMLLTILIMLVLGNNLFSLLVALSITAWCNTARQVRGMIKQLRESEYVYAAEVLGAKPVRIIVKHYIPNMLGILILDTATAIPSFIFTEAGLSFLGIGLGAGNQPWRTDFHGTAEYGFLSFSVVLPVSDPLCDRYGVQPSR